MNEHEQLSFDFEDKEKVASGPVPSGNGAEKNGAPKRIGEGERSGSSENRFIEVDDQCQYCGAPFESDRSCRYCAGNPTKRAYLKTSHK